ncbi:LytR C-terminal domain-containing protein [Naumannella sp. ID2617S]|nr:LytR C-terminal domain-containing protein [Naumannella sp. ID2617S]
MVGRIWRVTRTPLTLLALLALLGFGAKWGYEKVTAPLPPPYVEPCTNTPVTDGQLRSEQITVRVMNAGNKRGKAAEVSQQLKKQGFKVAKVGNAENQQEKSSVRGAGPDNPEVNLVASQFKGFEKVGDGRVDRSVEVIIGTNYESMIDNAPTTIKVTGNTVCLPRPPTAQPA